MPCLTLIGNLLLEEVVMSRSKIIEDAENNFVEQEFQDDISPNQEKELNSQSDAKTRKRIDELLEKKRLKELLDEDEWEL